MRETAHIAAFVSGGSGFLGAYVIEGLLRAGVGRVSDLRGGTGLSTGYLRHGAIGRTGLLPVEPAYGMRCAPGAF